MSEFQVIIVNMLLYVVLFSYCLYRYEKTNLSVALSFLYMVNAIFSVLLFIHPLYVILHPASQGTCTIQASLYLFLANLIFILAFDRCDISKLVKLEGYNVALIQNIEKFLCVCFIIYLIYQLPQSIAFFNSSSNLDDLRLETYGENLYSNNLLVSNIHKLLSASLLLLIIIVAVNYCFFRKFGIWDGISIIVFILMKVNAALGWVSRVAVVFTLIELVMIYLLFYHYIPKRASRRILVGVFFVLLPAFFFMSSISAARFGNREVGKESYSFLLYSGESQLNFMALPWNYLNEPFYGYHQLPIFRKYLGLDYPKDKTRIESTGYDSDIQKKYHYYHPTYIFHSSTGSFYFDWGKVGVFIIAAIFYYLLHRAYKNRHNVSFMAIVATIFLSALIGKGIFYLDYGNKAGNFMIIFMTALFFFLNNNGKSYKIKT